jgi:hypothetical protein
VTKATDRPATSAAASARRVYQPRRWRARPSPSLDAPSSDVRDARRRVPKKPHSPPQCSQCPPSTRAAEAGATEPCAPPQFKTFQLISSPQHSYRRQVTGLHLAQNCNGRKAGPTTSRFGKHALGDTMRNRRARGVLSVLGASSVPRGSDHTNVLFKEASLRATVGRGRHPCGVEVREGSHLASAAAGSCPGV